MKINKDLCNFCQQEDENPILGDFVVRDELKMHLNCMYTASGLMQDVNPSSLSDEEKKLYVEGFNYKNIKNELKRGRKLRCRHCDKRGACVGCVHRRCRSTFHLPCLFKAKGFTIFNGNFSAYCVHHRPLQMELYARMAEYKEPPDCCICLFGITLECQSNMPANADNTFPASPAHSQCMDTNSPFCRQRKRVIIVDGQSPLTPATKSRRSSIRLRTSLWEVNTSTMESGCQSAGASSQPKSPIPVEVEAWYTSLLPLTSAVPAKMTKNTHGSPFQVWSHGVLHGGCCRPAWMHRNCIAGYARSAGLHHVKCPLCFDRATFLKTITNLGIWLPDRDASWELDPEAFAAPINNDQQAIRPSPQPLLMASPVNFGARTSMLPVREVILAVNANQALTPPILRNRSRPSSSLRLAPRRRPTRATPVPISVPSLTGHISEGTEPQRLSPPEEPVPIESAPLMDVETPSTPPPDTTSPSSITSILKCRTNFIPPKSRKLRRSTCKPSKSIKRVPTRPTRRSIGIIGGRKIISPTDSTGDGMRQTCISTFFTQPDKIHIETTNNIFQNILRDTIQPGGRYNLWNRETGSPAQKSPTKPRKLTSHSSS